MFAEDLSQISARRQGVVGSTDADHAVDLTISSHDMGPDGTTSCHASQHSSRAGAVAKRNKRKQSEPKRLNSCSLPDNSPKEETDDDDAISFNDEGDVDHETIGLRPMGSVDTDPGIRDKHRGNSTSIDGLIVSLWNAAPGRHSNKVNPDRFDTDLNGTSYPDDSLTYDRGHLTMKGDSENSSMAPRGLSDLMGDGEEDDDDNYEDEFEDDDAHHRASISSPDSGSSSTRSSTPKKTTRSYKNLSRSRRIVANARERNRVHTISAAFEGLRRAVPSYSHNQKLSKLAILRIACSYILALANLADVDYAATDDEQQLSFGDCVDMCTRTLQSEGRSKRRKVLE